MRKRRRPGLPADIVLGLTAARIRAGLSQQDVADAMGASQSYVSLLESGQIVPRHHMLGRWADAVGLRARIVLEEQ